MAIRFRINTEFVLAEACEISRRLMSIYTRRWFGEIFLRDIV